MKNAFKMLTFFLLLTHVLIFKMFEVENIHQPCLWCHLSIQGVGLEDEGDPSLYYYHKISLYYYHKISSTSSQNMMHREQSNSTH